MIRIFVSIIGITACLIAFSCTSNNTACRQESTPVSTDSILHNQAINYSK